MAKLTMKELAKRMAALERTKRPNITIDGDCGTIQQRLRVLENLASMGRDIARELHGTSLTVSLRDSVTCHDLAIGHGVVVQAKEGASVTMQRQAQWGRED